jgi:hypothetical protein
LKNVNWSAAIIDAIEHRIRLEERMPNRDWDRVREADRMANAIFEEMHKKAHAIEPVWLCSICL